MTFTFDLATDRGRTRLLIPDRDEATAVFQDAEIDAFLAIEEGVYRASALALETVASDAAAAFLVTRSGGLSVDGAKASDAMLARAAKLREQAAEVEARDGDLFDWAEFAVDDFSARERLNAERLRSLP